MQWKASRLLVLCAICSGPLSNYVIAQKISFGLITGAQLTDDYRTLICPPLAAGQMPSPGCPLAQGLFLSVTNASRPFIFGPKEEVQVSPSF